MIKKVNHIGIAVADLDEGIQRYKAMGFAYDKTEEVPSQKVNTAFFEAGESHVELLAATSAESPIAKFLQKRGPGIHHICVEVEDIDAALATYKAEGLKLIHEEPFIGAGGHRVAFVHPKATGGVLLELLESKS